MNLASTLGRRFKFEFIARILYNLSGAILTIALARLLDPDGYGLLFLAISVLGVIEMFSRLGFGKSTARYIATFKERDPTQIPHILRVGFLLNLLVLALVCVILLFTYEQIASLIDEQALAPFLFIGILYIIFTTATHFSSPILQGFEAIEITAILRAARGVIKLILAIGLVLLGFGAFGAFVGYLLAYGVAGVLGVFYIYMVYYRGSEQGKRQAGICRRVVEYSIPITATSTASTIDRHTDTVLLGYFIGPTAVAFYTIGKQVVGFIETPASALGFTLAPTYETQREKGNSETTARIFEEGVSHTLLLYIPAAAGLILVAEPLIKLVFGKQYLGAVPVLQILSIYIVFHTINEMVGSGLDFLGRARERAIVRGVSAILNIVLNLILIPIAGVIGAAIATTLSYSLYTVSNLYIMGTEVELRHIYLFKQTSYAILVATVMSGTVYIFVDDISTYFSLFITVCLGIAVWTGLVTLLGLLNVRQLITIIE